MNGIRRFGVWFGRQFWRLLAATGVLTFLTIYAVNNRYWYKDFCRTDRWTGHVEMGRWTSVQVGVRKIKKPEKPQTAWDAMFESTPSKPAGFDLTPYLDNSSEVEADAESIEVPIMKQVWAWKRVDKPN